jgi:hypothetical protein
MQRFFENKFAFAAVLVLFVMAMVLNATQGSSSPATPNQWASLTAAQTAHGPSIPPDPWDWNKAQHGPSIPPDPWDWQAVNHGPSIPPDPWDWNKLQHGPSIPPDPWDWAKAA